MRESKLRVEATRRRDGLSLMEVVIATGVLAAALLALIGVFTSGLRLMSQSEQVTTATQLGRDFLERTKAAGPALLPEPGIYDGRLPSLRESTGFPADPYPSVTVDGGEYFLVVEVADKAPDLKSLVVEVWWSSNQKVTLQTYVHR